MALVFYASPHSTRYTKTILDYFMSRLEDYNFNIVDCYKRNVYPCIDCGYCKIHNSCKFNDMDDIDTYLRESDLLIFASPIYNFSFPAPLKAMLDRMQRYFCSRFDLNIIPPIKKKKKAIILLTCGSDEPLGEEIIKKQLNKVFTVINTKLLDTVLWSKTDYLDNLKLDYDVKNKIDNMINTLKTHENS